MNHGLDTDEHIYFYEPEFYALGNFSAFAIWCTADGLDRRFDTSEALYHWHKFPDHEGLRAAVLTANSAHDSFKIAENAVLHRRADWDIVKVGVMREILRIKVNQHEYVHRKLLATGKRNLIENSWRDTFWGEGPWRDGQNMLGKLWMEIREELHNNPRSWTKPRTLPRVPLQ